MDNYMLFEMHIMSWYMLVSFAFVYPKINATNSWVDIFIWIYCAKGEETIIVFCPENGDVIISLKNMAGFH